MFSQHWTRDRVLKLKDFYFPVGCYSFLRALIEYYAVWYDPQLPHYYNCLLNICTEAIPALYNTF